MTLVELALSVVYPFGLILDDSDLEAQAIAAARFYLGHGRIAALDGPITYDNPTVALFTPRTLPYLGPSDAPGVISSATDYGPGTRMGDRDAPTPTPPTPAPAPKKLDAQTQITDSEWALIMPLYMLYVERENARVLETSRQQGVEVFGRTVSEIQSDIDRQQTDVVPRAAFFQAAETV